MKNKKIEERVNGYSVDTGIPIIRITKESKYSKIVASMNVGDSVLVESKVEAQGLAVAIRKNESKAITRKVEDGKFRVWKQ